MGPPHIHLFHWASELRGYPSSDWRKTGLFPFQEPQVNEIGELCLQVGVRGGYGTLMAAESKKQSKGEALKASFLLPSHAQERPWARSSLPLFLVSPQPMFHSPSHTFAPLLLLGFSARLGAVLHVRPWAPPGFEPRF